METKIKVAIQKSGRLSEKSIELLNECGITFDSGKGALKMQSSNFPIELLLLRDDDIPEYVSTGVADLGVVGQNVVTEKDKEVVEVRQLGFGKCRLSLAVSNKFDYKSVRDLDGLQFATSYPVILGRFLDREGIKATIHKINGSVEIAPSIGLADAICDIVSTGSTLMTNGLKEVEPIMRSQAVLIATPNLADEKQALLDKLIFRMNAVQMGKKSKYILLNAPNDKVERICEI
ncbi:MAG: hypothetical protein RIS47_1091, partial [Bacteroidota bacterium]